LFTENKFLGEYDLSQIQNQSKETKNISLSHQNLIKGIINEIDRSIKGKRKIMYYDIINLIIREDYRGKLFNEIILWCNYKIKQGEYFVLID
jgi:hypothetical protein